MADSLSPRELLLLPIHWRKKSEGHWSASVRGHECSLRMNDFPEEPLYTIVVHEKSLDIDDAPQCWRIE